MFREASLDRAPTVAVNIIGGLGNQLFQYATARALADRMNANLILDCSDKRDRKVELGRYHIRASIVESPSSVRKTYLRLPGTFGGKLSKAAQQLLPPFMEIDNQIFDLFQEQRWFQYDARIEQLGGAVYLDGFWQSFRYFDGLIDSIRADLRLIASLNPTNVKWQRQMKETASVCVHVRRGDYVGKEQTFGLCSIAYYRCAMEYIRGRHADAKFFLFSDDLAWCRQNFAAEGLIFVDSNSPDTAVDDLELMRSCRHHIIANSSLSWWGAWLATSPDQLVIAPTPWFISEPADDDLICKHWVRLPQN
jgi:hypothetical protein